MANHALTLCHLLAVGTVTTAAAAAAHRRLLQQRPRLDDDLTDATSTTVRSVGAAAGGCWKSILASESCVRDMAESLASLHVRVSRACYSVLEKIGDKCVVHVSSTFIPFSPPVVKLGCGLAA